MKTLFSIRDNNRRIFNHNTVSPQPTSQVRFFFELTKYYVLNKNPILI